LVGGNVIGTSGTAGGVGITKGHGFSIYLLLRSLGTSV
jgi:hypothetical protein